MIKYKILHIFHTSQCFTCRDSDSPDPELSHVVCWCLVSYCWLPLSCFSLTAYKSLFWFLLLIHPATLHFRVLFYFIFFLEYVIDPKAHLCNAKSVEMNCHHLFVLRCGWTLIEPVSTVHPQVLSLFNIFPTFIWIG